MDTSEGSVVADCVRNEVVVFSGAGKPAKESDPEAWKHNELWPSRQFGMSTRRRFSRWKASSGRNPGGDAWHRKQRQTLK